jgi:hypothetical protein
MTTMRAKYGCDDCGAVWGSLKTIDPDCFPYVVDVVPSAHAIGGYEVTSTDVAANWVANQPERNA